MSGRLVHWPAFLVAFVTLAGSAAALRTVIRLGGIHLTKRPIEAPGGAKFHTLPSSFPRENPRWEQARPDDRMTAESLQELGTENYISRWYRRTGAPGGAPVIVQLHCAYYTGMIDTVPHVPERCMVGGGMELTGSSELVDVPLDFSRLVEDPDRSPDERGPVWMGRSTESQGRVRLPLGVGKLQLMTTRFKDQSGQATLYAGYFFIANGGVVASADQVRLLAFRLKDDYAYYAKVQFMSPAVGSAEELGRLAGDMLDGLFPEIMRRVPDWTEVEEGRYPQDNPRRARSGAAREAASPGAGVGPGANPDRDAPASR